MKKNEELISDWNEAVAKLPKLESTKTYDCPKCGKHFTMAESKGDIGAWGIDIECPDCGKMVAFESLGHSEFE